MWDYREKDRLYREFSANVKKGDVVLVSGPGGTTNVSYYRAEVISVTKTQIRVRTGRAEFKFRRETGREFGSSGSWRYYHVEPWNDEVWQEQDNRNKRRNISDELDRTEWRALPLDSLERIQVFVRAEFGLMRANAELAKGDPEQAPPTE